MKNFLLAFVLVTSISSNVFAIHEESTEESTHRLEITQLRRQTEREQLRTNLLRTQAENNLLVQLGQLNLNNQNKAETRNLLSQLVRQLQVLIPAH